MSVFVTWCDPGEVQGAFAESLIGLFAVGVPNGLVSGWARLETGPVLDKARNEMTERFLATSADWMLMVDADMTFNADLLERLLRVADPAERPIVGPLCYSMSHAGPWPVLYELRGGQFYPIPDPPADTLLRVDGAGTGCLLIHRSALERIAASSDWPGQWFDHVYLSRHPLGEDLSFCVRARQAGLPIWVDTGIPIGHVKARLKVERDMLLSWRRSHRFVVTGTGRCGTAYLAALFRQIRIPCGHETVFGPDGPQEWGGRQGDSSWMAAPFLPLDGKVFHLLRNPLAVADSLVGIGFFDPKIDHGKYREFARSWCPQAFQTDDPILAATTFIICWNQMIAPHADMTVRVEEITPTVLRDLARQVGAEPGLFYTGQEMVKVPTNLNSRRRAGLDWSKVPSELADHAEELGYGVAAI